MKNRKCVFTIEKEIEGNKTKTEVKGTTLSESFEREMKEKKYQMVLVEEEETGKTFEVFANSIQFVK